MLNATTQKLGDTAVVRCQGRIVIGDAYAILRDAVFRQTEARTLILDLARVDRIDAGGLGVLLGLREWACSRAIRFQLMNVMKLIEDVLELTKLDRVFEFCSIEDMLQLLHFAAAPHSVDQENQRITAGTAAREQELAGVPADAQFGTNWHTDTNEAGGLSQGCDSCC